MSPPFFLSFLFFPVFSSSLLRFGVYDTHTLSLSRRRITPQATGTHQPVQRPTPTPIAARRTPHRTPHRARHLFLVAVITPPRPVTVNLGVAATVCTCGSGDARAEPLLDHPLELMPVPRGAAWYLPLALVVGELVTWYGHILESGHPDYAHWKIDCCGMDLWCRCQMCVTSESRGVWAVRAHLPSHRPVGDLLPSGLRELRIIES